MILLQAYTKKAAAMLMMMLVACAAYGQSFSVDQTTVTVYGSATASYFNKAIKVYNNTSGNLQLRWVRMQQIMPPSWRTSVCNEYYCFPMSTDSAMFTITPGDSDMVDMHFYPFDTPGSATIYVDLYVVNDPSERMTLTFNGNAPVGVEEQVLAGMNVYPNPVSDKVYIDAGKANAGLSVEVYDQLGQIVKRESFVGTGDHAELNVSDLSAGCYMMKIRDDDDKVAVKKFIKQ